MSFTPAPHKMASKPSHSPSGSPEGGKNECPREKEGRTFRKILRIAAILLGSLIVLVILLVAGVSLYLSSGRLTDLVNNEAGKYINADIHAKKISYTLWRSFPRLDLRIDSATVISRTLDTLTPAQLRSLPADAKKLASLKSFSGSINIVDLFLNRYVIHDIRIEGLNVNLVVFNDSVNNYNIAPSSGEKMKRVPFISAELIDIRNQGSIRYFSLPSNTSASIMLSNLVLDRHHGKGEGNLYHLLIEGKINASSAELSILKGFPFNLSGDLLLHFNPFGVRLTDYAINLGELKSRLSMSLGIGDDPKIESLNYRISDINIMNLLGYIPKEFRPSLQGIKADLPINASARLMSEWSFSSPTFPSLRIDFSTPAGSLDYEMAYSQSGNSNSRNPKVITFPLEYSPVSGIFFFNGSHPDKSYIEIPEFRVATDGLEVSMSARADNLTTSPEVKANVRVNSDLRRATDILPYPLPAMLSGTANLETDVSFNLESLTREGLEKGFYNLNASGHLALGEGRLQMKSAGIDARVSNLEMAFSQSSSSLTSDYIGDPNLGLTLRIGKISGVSPEGSFGIKGLRFSTGSSIRGKVKPDDLQQAGVPADVDLTIADMGFHDARDRFGIRLSSTHLADRLTSSPDPEFAKKLLSDGLTLTSESISIHDKQNRFRIHNPSLSFTLAERQGKIAESPAKGSEAPVSLVTPDSAAPAPAAHTPELLNVNLPDALREFMNSFSLTAALKASKIDLMTPGGDPDNHLAEVSLNLDEDYFGISAGSMMLEKTRGRMDGRISNIRNFLLLSPSEENPLDIFMDMRIDTVNINSLAHTYALAKGGIDKIPTKSEVRPDDSIALLIPRNLKVDLTASAKETIYMNLHLNDLETKIFVRNGTLRIPTLNLSTDFGNASMNVEYDTSDLYNMNFKVGANLDGINITNFFKNFRGLLSMMPEMKNLSGMLSIGMEGRGRVFPDMSLNTPSVVADLDLEGTDLKVHQSKFIRRITRMMLIRSDSDIRIRDIAVHAGIHDNLLQLDPFDFEFDRYKLHVLGINNFNGRLYYHLAVMKSPIPFPFSINIEGMFRDPRLRFGGPRYNAKKGEEVTSRIQEDNNINIVAIMRGFMGAFIKKAAEASVDPGLSL